MYFISTKFNQNPSSGSGEVVENAKSLQTTDGALKKDKFLLNIEQQQPFDDRK